MCKQGVQGVYIAAIWMVENNEYLLIIKRSHVDVMSLSLGLGMVWWKKLLLSQYTFYGPWIESF